MGGRGACASGCEVSFRIRVLTKVQSAESASIVLQLLGDDADVAASALGQVLADKLVAELAKTPLKTRAPSSN